MIRLQVISIIILLLTLGLFQPPSLRAQVLKQSFSESLADFKISTPSAQWLFAPRSIAPGAILATLRFESAVNKFFPNVTVRVLPLFDKKIELEKWVTEDLSQLPDDVKVVEKKKITHQGIPGFQIQLREDKNDLHFLQWVFLAKEKSFIITCTTKTSNFGHFLGDFKKILNSFEIR